MTPAFDILLPVGAAAFYLYDCLLPLYGNELLLTCRGKAWIVRRPSHFVLFGRKIAVLPLLLPNEPAFQAAVSPQQIVSASETGGTDDVAQFLAATRGLGAIALILMALLLFALPVASIALGAGIIVLGIFVAYYLTLLAGLALVFRRRQALGVAGRGFAALAFDVLLCPPFGVNILRKVTLRGGLRGNPVAFARRQFGPDALEDLRAALLDWEIEAARRRPLEEVEVEPVPAHVALLKDRELWR